ncbi:MAG: glucose PTS transporter subunit IIA [Coprococcus catus]|uniref:PTS transporter subunit IIABC n=1 Tax=Coprococcus catus TaxID=116085 RepID=UPI001C0147A8|nr:PTS transporter subunit IIABC [Coprococcus catus]MBT9770684.1 PTS glucose transporter subunit IIA [Coprococcus catus]MEE0818926.1 glucose PTS transporter subunit IIA [Coprococcus catus]
MKKHLFSLLQRIGQSFMLPIALLPIAGIFLGIGSSLTNTNMLAAYHLKGLMGPGTAPYILFSLLNSAGSIIFDNLPILFAVGVAIGMARSEKATAALSSIIAFFVMHSTIGSLITYTGRSHSFLTGATTEIVGITSLQMGVFGGIIVGLGVAALHNRFYKIELPKVFSFFGGTHFIPIISAITYVGIGILMFYIWPPIQILINDAGKLVLMSGYGGTFVYGLLERALIPFGLHHVFYMPFWQTAVGGRELVNGQLIEGAQNIFFAELASPDTSHFSVAATRFMSGKFPLMMFGLPGAALAMYTCARPENKKAVGSLLLSAAISSAVTGITEPLEFAFLFVAPPLYVIHCAFAGLSYMLMHMLNVGIGMTFSGGFLDFFLFGILQGNTKTSWLHVIPVGILYFIVYFIVFRVMILKFNYQTPGHEKDNAAPVNNADNKSQQILDGLGGLENISDLSCCATRLRVTLHRPSKLNKEKLLATGAAAVVANGDGVQVVYGPEVTVIHARLQDYISQIIPASSSTADNSAAVPTTSAEVSNPAVSAEAKDSDNLSVADAITDIVYAPCNGTVIPLKEINDGVFSEGYIGEGLAIEPVDGSFYAPFDCSVAMVFDTHHAIALHTANDTELILHVGLDTVKLNGQHLEVFVQEGQKIQKGDLILRADLEGIQSAGCRTVTPVVITGAGGAESVELLKTGPVHIGDAVLKVHY